VAFDKEAKGKVALLIRVPPEMHRCLKVTARTRGLSMSDLVQKAISRDIGFVPAGKSIAERIRNAG
jgi:hypothetical protein